MANRIANVKLLLDYQACIAAKDICQVTPLHYAWYFNRTNDIVRYLLIKSDSSELQSNKLKWMGQSSHVPSPSLSTCFGLNLVNRVIGAWLNV